MCLSNPTVRRQIKDDKQAPFLQVEGLGEYLGGNSIFVYFGLGGSFECNEIKIGSGKWVGYWQRNLRSTGPLCLSPITRYMSHMLCHTEGSGTRVPLGPCPRGTGQHLQTACSLHHCSLRPTSLHLLNLFQQSHSLLGALRATSKPTNSLPSRCQTPRSPRWVKIACRLPGVFLTIPADPALLPPPCPGQCRSLPALGQALLAPGAGQDPLPGVHGSVTQL